MSAAPPASPRTALLDHPLLREGRLWQAGSLGRCQSHVFSSGFAALDAELPGGGWPSQSLCEILQPAGQHAEWRLLAPALRRLFAPPSGGATSGGSMGCSSTGNSAVLGSSRGSKTIGGGSPAMPPILLIAPPFMPHGPGLLDLGLEAAQWVWIKATPGPEDIGTQGRLESYERLNEVLPGGRMHGGRMHGRAHAEVHEALRQQLPLGERLAALQGSQQVPQRIPKQGSRQRSQQGEHRGSPALRHSRAQQTLHQALWAAEQAIKSQAAGAVLAWLDDAQPEQIRRLQAAALNSPVPIFLMRPDSAATQSSAAPLRLRLSQPAASRGLAPGLLEVLLLKRRGPAMVQPLQLHSLPPRLEQSLPARLRQGVAPPQPPAHAGEPARTQQAPGRLSPLARASMPEVEA
ncbi:hypothetical protein H5407_13310 [Mitsuaria sp. WAJ17]|uniref:hypothetical protein n=1 Tax=Mitsuaria sp. WAJ17 TaxID=2761452 RepID=UPI00160449F2|nr:hypothetical protein [Mitsuaria sp. WAJ17]